MDEGEDEKASRFRLKRRINSILSSRGFTERESHQVNNQRVKERRSSSVAERFSVFSVFLFLQNEK